MATGNAASPQGEAESIIDKFKKNSVIAMLTYLTGVALAVGGGTWWFQDLVVVQRKVEKIETLEKAIDVLKQGPQPPGPLTSPMALEPQITIRDQPIRDQRHPVTVSIEPPPPSGQIVQIWVRQGDSRWYPCFSADQISTTHLWTASCMFGRPEKRDAQAGKSKFGISAFYSNDLIKGSPTGLTDAEWYTYDFKRAEIHNIVFTGP